MIMKEMEQMSEEKTLAVLIDSDNVSAKYVNFIMQEIQKYGIPTYKRVYGDWEKGGNSWHDAAINYSIMPVQQCSYIAGKNATDFSMIIDAMDILYTGRVDGFVLVTSDSDFTRLAMRLREAGKIVIGIGELKTPRAFTISCHHFCYLNPVCALQGTADEDTVRKAVLEFVENYDGERLDLLRISAMLTSKFGDINYSEWGYKRFSNFIDSFAELKRSNTFVSMAEKPAKGAKQDELTEEAVTEALLEYFEKNPPEHDNLIKIESYLNNRFGKIDFSLFGSKKFARFIDKNPKFRRSGTFIELAPEQPEIMDEDTFRKEVTDYTAAGEENGVNLGGLNNYLLERHGKDYFKDLGFQDLHSALVSVPGLSIRGNRIYMEEHGTDEPDLSSLKEKVISFASANMPSGGNMGQLNNELLLIYGKDYFVKLGFTDYKSFLSSIEGITINKNFIFLNEPEPSVPEEPKEPEKTEPSTEEITEPEVTESETEPADVSAAEETAGTVDEDKAPEQNEKQEKEPEKPPVIQYEKPEINVIKRDMINFAATSESATVAKLGALLSGKYGRDFLKQLGMPSMRRLIGEVPGLSIKNNKIILREEFAKQTEEIERFVNEFARADGSHSIRALVIRLKSEFEGFDFRNYGFARFTDFINAIDGVTADRYHIKPVNPEE